MACRANMSEEAPRIIVDLELNLRTADRRAAVFGRLLGLRIRAAAVLVLFALLPAVLSLAWPAAASAQQPPRDPVTITSFGKVDPNPATHPQPVDKVDGEFEVKVSFNRRVTGFTADDFEVDHGSTSDLSVSNGNWTVTVTVDEGYEGPLTVTLPANAVDEGNAERSLSFTVDQTAPTAELSVLSSVRRPIADWFYTYLTFSEAIKLGEDSDTGLLAGIRLQKSDLSVTTGWVLRLDKVRNDESGRRYRAYISQGSHEGDYTITLPAGVVQDDVGNPNEAATITVPVDGLSPTVEISGPESGYVLKGESFDVTFQFSEAVTGFAEDDITVIGGTLTASSLASSGANAWTASVAASAEASEVAIEVRATAVKDTARRTNATTKAAFDAVDPPTEVRDIQSEFVREGALGFSWVGPGDDGGAPIVEYQFRYGPGTGDDVEYTEWESAGFESSGEPSRDVEITGLTNGTEYSIQMRARNGAAAGPHVTATGRPNPNVSISTATRAITEGDAVTFTLTRTGGTTNTLAVDVCSKVLAEGDCTERTATVTFNAGSETATYRVTTDDNDNDDPNRNLVVLILAQDAAPYTYKPGLPGGAFVTVRDNDNAKISVSPASTTAVEEGDPAVFSLERDGLLSPRLNVKVLLSQTGAFLTDSQPVWVVFPSGHATATLSVPTDDDDRAEDDGTITATIANGSDWRVGPQASATRTVVSDDRWQLVTIAPKPGYNVVEGRDAIFVLTRKQVNADDTTDDDVSDRGSLTVTVALSENVPEAGPPHNTPRYTSGDERTVTFAAGASTATLRVPTAENRYSQRSHRLTVTPEDGAGYRTPAAGEAGDSAEVPIADDDNRPGIHVSAPSQVNEGEDAVFTLTRSGDTTVGLRVDTVVTGSVRVLSPEARRSLPNNTTALGHFVGEVRVRDPGKSGEIHADFEPGSATTTLTFGTQADETAEGDGRITIRGVAHLANYFFTSHLASITVKDDDTAVLTLELVDPPPAVAGRSNTYLIEEGAELTWRVTRTGGTDHDFFYGYETDRTSGHDRYHDSTGWAQSYDSSREFGDDDIVDLTGIGNIAERLWSIPEGNTRTTVRTRAHFVTPTGGELHMRLRDPYPGCNRCPQYTLGTSNEFRLIITNRTPGISITAGSNTVEEGGNVTFTLTRTWNEENTRNYATHVDLAFDDPDGVISGTPPATVTIPKGQTSATFTLQMTDDEIDDDEEREFTVSVAAPEKPSEQTFEGEFEALAPFSATVTVTDNDEPPLPVVTIAEREGRTWRSEAAGEIEFVVARAGGSGALVVHLDVARQGSFFPSTPAVPSSVTIEAGKDKKIVRVPVEDDTVVEAAGSVTVSIAARSTYDLGDPSSARVDVLDNEAYFVIADATVEEGDDDGHGNPVDSVDVTVTFVGQSVAGSLASVDWATQDGTAEAGSDYTAKNGSIEVPAGTCKVPPGIPSCSYPITIPIIDDSVDEADETFKIVLSNPNNANGLPYGTVTITDDDDATVTASIEAVAESDVLESAGHIELLVKLSAPSQNTVEVDWRTIKDTSRRAATPGADFFAASGTATFPRGSTEQRIRVAIRDDKEDEDSEFVYVGLIEARNARILRAEKNEYGWIRDDDVRGVTAAPATLSIPEDGNDTYTLVLDTRPTDNVTVAVNVPAGSDLSASPTSLTFTRLNWDQPQTVTVTAAADADNIADAPVTITHSASGGDYGPAPTDSVTVTITGDAGATLSVTDAEAPEGAGAVVFTVTLTGSPSSQVTVSYATSNGTATAGQDYTSTSGTLTFPAGNAGTRTVRVPVTDDSDGEENETFTLTLSGEANATLAVATATGTILDDDAGLVVTGGRAAETAGEIVFTVTRQGSTRKAVSVSYTTRDGTALAGSDYTARSGRLTFARGESSKTVSVPVTNDLLDEPDEETFTLRLSGPAGTVIAAGKGTAAGVIVDDDRMPRLYFESLSKYAEEAAGPISFTVKLSAASGRRVEVDYATRETPGQAKAGSDFTAVDGTLVFAPGETEKTITVQLVDDDVAESVETFGLVLHDAVNASISSGEAAAIISDKDLYNVTVTAREEKVSEGSALVFDVWRDGDTSRELVVTLGRTVEQVDDPCDPEEASSCERDDVTVTFKGAGFNDGEPGQSRVAYRWKSQVDPSAGAGKGFAYTVTVKADSREPAQYRPGTPASASTAVASTGVLMVLAYEKMDPLWAQQGDEVSVKWTVINLSNTAATDVKVKTDRTEGTHDCADSLPGPSDDDEYSSCTVTAAYAATAADVTAGKLTINASVTKTAGAESNAVQVVFPQGDGHTLAVRNSVPADEYSNRSALFFKVSLNEPSTETVTVAYATSDGTATGNTAGATSCGGIGVNFVTGFDYIPASGTLTFDPGDTEEILRVHVCDDRKPEADETVIFTISSPSGANLDPDRSIAEGTILDNDRPATNPSITIAMVGGGDEVAEDAGYAEFTLTLSGGTNDTVTVAWAAEALAEDDARAAAAAGMDYTAAGGTVTFPPRTTEQRIRVPIINDMMDEANLEYLQVTLSDPVNANIKAPGTIDLAIRDDDVRGVTVFPNQMSLDEGDTGTYSVSLKSQPTEAEGVTIALSVQTNRGVSVAPASLTFTQDNWRDAQMVAVTSEIDDDSTTGAYVIVTNRPSGSDYDGLHPAVVQVTVLDRPVFMVADKTVAENGGSVTVEVTLDRTLNNQAITVEWETVDGTATAGNDYTAASGTLTFAADDASETISVTITDDSLDEDAETFSIALSNPSGNVGIGGPGTVTITDNDNPPTLTIAEVGKSSEDSGEGRFRVRLLDASEKRVTVEWLTTRYSAAGTATPGDDFIEARGTLTFEPGEDQKDFTVVIVDDAIVEEREIYRVKLRNAVNAQLYDPPRVDAEIIDNDSPGVEVKPTAVDMLEGGTGEYTLRLKTQPTEDVTITVTVPANTDLTAGATSFTFTMDNWDQPQTVTLTAAEDADVSDDEVSLTHAASGGGYGDVSVDGVTVTIVDNDLPTLSIADGEADEDAGSIEFTVTLSQASDKDVSAAWSTANGTAEAGSDYIGVAEGRLSIPAGDTTAAVTVTVVADGVVEPDETFTVTLADLAHATFADNQATGTIRNDDEMAVTVDPTTLTIGEGGVASYRVSIGSQPTGGDVKVEVTVPSSTDVSANPTTLTFTADNWRSPRFVDVTAASDDDAVADAPVTLTHAVSGGGYDSVTASAVTVTIEEENERGVDVSPTTLSLDEGESGVYSVVLRSQPTANVTVTITVPADAGATVDKTSLTFTSDNWDDAQEVEVSATEDDDASSPEPFTITHAVSGGDYASESADSVTVTVDDTTVTMLVFQGSDILTEGVKAAESAGTMAFVVSLQIESGETVTVNYSTSNGTATAGSDYTRTAGRLTFSAGETTKTISVPVLNDRVDEDDETFTLTVSSAVNADLDDGGSSLTVTGTIEDDDTRGLVLSHDALTVPEGGRRSYTVALESRPTTNVTITIRVPAGADVSVNTRKLTFTPANWNVTQTVTVNAYQDRDAQPDPKAAIEHTASGGDYGFSRSPGSGPISAAVDVTVIEDDEPTITLSLDVDTISENEGVATVTASLSEQSSAETTIVVSIDPADISTLSENKTLTIAAGQTASTGEVTITAVDDSAYTGDRQVTVKGAAANTAGLQDPDEVMLTIAEDDDLPQVTLALDSDTISENGGVATVTASLSEQSSAETTIVVSIDPADISTLSENKTLTIAAGQTASTGEVTITAVDDSAYTGDRQVTVKGAAANTAGLQDPDEVMLTIAEDDDLPQVTLALDSDTISENGGVATVTASLSEQSSAATTITVSIDPTTTSALSSNTTLTIAKGATTSTGEVKITATDDSTYTGNREVTVSGSAANDVGVDGPEDVTLTITDDDTKPQVTLSLDSDTISENGGVATVTASLSTTSGAATTITVSIDPTTTSALSSNTTLTIAKGATTSTGEVKITATDDSTYTGNREVTVSGSAANNVGVDGPEDVTLTITDDDDKPKVTLSLDSDTISENGGVATVTASLSTTSGAATTITVSIDPTTTSALSSNTTLTIAKGATTSTGEVKITATDDSTYTGNREVTVSGSAANNVGVDGPEDVTLTITDDDDKPKVTLSLDSDTISENGGVATVTASLSTTSGAATTITVSIDPTTTSALSSNTTLTIAKGATTSTGEVKITATDDSTYTGNREVTVSGSAANNVGVDGPEDVTLTITDDDDKPKVTLSLDSDTISENGGVATVTASLSTTSGAATTITVSIDPTTTSALSSNTTLTIAKGATTSTGEVKITATDDSTYTGNREVTVKGAATNSVGVDGPDDVTLTITDDDTKPKVTLVLTPSTISESGASNASTVTATLSASSTAATTITVSIDPTTTSALSSNTTLTIAKGATTSTGEVKITATDDSTYTGNREVTVSGSAANDVGVDGPDDVTLTITDDEVRAVTVSFEQAAYTVAEGGAATVKVTLSAAPERQVVIILNKADQNGASSADYSGVPSDLTFGASDTEKTFTFNAMADDVDDDDESVILSFGGLPTGVSAGTTPTGTVSITDDDVPAVTVSYEQAAYTVAEGGSATVKVTLSEAPERQVVVPVAKTNEGGASSADYSGVPSSLTFGATDTAKTFTFLAMADDVDDDGESVDLAFGTLPTGVSAGTTSTSTVSITDDDVPSVTVSYEQASYAVVEGETETVKVTLSEAPERQVVVPITTTNQDGASAADYSGVPSTLTFGASDTEKTFTFTAMADSVTDSGESVDLDFGALPTGVSAGPNSEANVLIVEVSQSNLTPNVTVSFDHGSYRVEEGQIATEVAPPGVMSEVIMVGLSEAPGRTVEIPLIVTNWDGASGDDYSGVPASLTFGPTDKRKPIFFRATDDDLDDDGETVVIEIGDLPSGVSVGRDRARVYIMDNDGRVGLWVHSMKSDLSGAKATPNGHGYSQTTNYKTAINVTKAVSCSIPRVLEEWTSLTLIDGTVITRDRVKADCEQRPWFVFHFNTPNSARELEIYGREIPSTGEPGDYKLVERRVYGRCGTANDEEEGACWGTNYSTSMADNRFVRRPGDKYSDVLPTVPGEQYQYFVKYFDGNGDMMWRTNDVRPDFEGTRHDWGTQAPYRRWTGAYQSGASPESSEQQQAQGHLPAPENLAATASSDRIELTWDAVAGAESYRVLRRNQADALYAEIAVTTTNSYTDTTAVVAQGYAYKVQAQNDSGDSEFSDHVLAMIDPPPPDAPTGFQAVVGDDSVTLSWDASDDDTITSYMVIRQVRDADPPQTVLLRRKIGETNQVTDSSPESGAAYTYSVMAINAGGRSDAATVDVDIPADTGGLTVTRSGPTFNLSWDEVDGATSYNVLRMGPGETEHSKVATSETTSYTDYPTGSGTFSYRIQPVEDGEAGDAFAPVTAEMLPPPDPPTDLQATAASGSVTLTWTAPSQTLLTYLVSRKVRDADPPEEFALLGAAAGDATAYTDTTVEADTAYAYQLVAVGTEFESDPVEVEVDTPPASPLVGFTLVDGGANALNGESLPAGSYTLTATAYSGSSLGGDELGTLEVSFTVIVDDPDSNRDGAVSLGDQSPDRGRQFFYDKSLDRANGDGVDYYTFTTDGRYELGLGARDQSIELKVTLEDADGNVVGTAGPPADPNKDQVYIEWLKITIDAGAYYVRVEALADGQTDYYIRFGLTADE